MADFRFLAPATITLEPFSLEIKTQNSVFDSLNNTQFQILGYVQSYVHNDTVNQPFEGIDMIIAQGNCSNMHSSFRLDDCSKVHTLKFDKIQINTKNLKLLGDSVVIEKQYAKYFFGKRDFYLLIDFRITVKMGDIFNTWDQPLFTCKFFPEKPNKNLTNFISIRSKKRKERIIDLNDPCYEDSETENETDKSTRDSINKDEKCIDLNEPYEDLNTETEDGIYPAKKFRPINSPQFLTFTCFSRYIPKIDESKLDEYEPIHYCFNRHLVHSLYIKDYENKVIFASIQEKDSNDEMSYGFNWYKVTNVNDLARHYSF